MTWSQQTVTKGRTRLYLLTLTVCLSLFASTSAFAQLRIRNSAGTEIIRASQSGSLSVGTTSANAKMTVAGNGIIGSGMASATPPSNGLIVEGRTLIGTASSSYSHKMIVIDSPNYAAGIYTEVGPAAGDGADGEAITA